jgi:tetratricopeptide (TPR) repeat protein
MARIYVSSTYSDLKEHREKVYRVLRQLGHDAVAMEDYVATDQRPLARCLADVEACDLYVGIFAHRYGYIPERGNPDRRSITELEYRHAQTRGIPHLIFLLDLKVPWLPSWIDAFTGDGDQGTRIRAFRDELQREHLVSFFSNADELAQKVSVAVTNRSRYQLVGGLPAVNANQVWTIPPPVRLFVGRDEQLAALHDQLTGRGAATLVPTAALSGMGGVGKTQLALAYAHRYREEYQLGWWVPAETELGILTALGTLGVALGLPPELPPPELAAQVRDALAQRSEWLLIFDNASDPTAVAEFLPVTGGGHALVTSRDPAWQGIADLAPVDVLTLDEAIELLRRHSGDSDRQAGAELAEALGRLPLALEQAGAYAGRLLLGGYQDPLARYLSLFRRRHRELLAIGRPIGYPRTVDATFALALDQLRDTDLPAVSLLEIIAFLASDKIPVRLLLSQPEHLPSPIAEAAHNSVAKDKMVTALLKAGLLTPDRDQSGVTRTHPIIQHVTEAHLSRTDRQQRIEQSVELLAALFPDEGWRPEHQQLCVELLPHARTVLRHAASVQLATPAVAQLLLTVGHYLWGSHLAVYEARALHLRALVINRRLYRGDHPVIVRNLNELGADLRRLDRVEEARDMHTQALEMSRRLYKGDHPAVARSLAGVAVDLRRLGETEEARELDLQALVMRQRLHTEDHPDVARSLFGLAMDMRALYEIQRAWELDVQALEMRRRLYHSDHPAISYSISNLAVNLHMSGDVDRARELEIEALEMRGRLYHGNHPETATNLLILRMSSI